MITQNRKTSNEEILGIRALTRNNKGKILILVILVVLISTAVVLVKYRSPIGKELSHSYWPKEDLENKNGKVILQYIGKSLINKTNTLFSRPDVPSIFVDIRFKHYRKLKKWRNRVIERGFALERDRKYVPATIRYGPTKTKVKIRLKGDIFDHYDTDRWSFRVKVRGRGSVLGMRAFSVQEPERRGFSAEAVFFEHLKQYDIMVPRYRFVNLILNGESWGIMAVEEVPSKELIESTHRRESVIFRYDDSTAWQTIATGDRELARYYQNHFKVNFAAYGMKKVEKDANLYHLYLRGMALLEGWREGKLRTSDVFDINRWARVIALSEIWHSRHQLKYHNLRFYFNPITERFEPLVYDRGKAYYNDENRPSNLLILRDVPFVHQLLQDPEMKAAFENALRETSEDIISGWVIKKLQPFANSVQEQLIHDKFYLMKFPFNTLVARSKALLSRQDFEQETVREPIYSEVKGGTFGSLGYGTFYRTNQGITVGISNKLPVAVQLCGLVLKDKKNAFEKILFTSQLDEPIELPAAVIPHSRNSKRAFKFALPAKESLALSRSATVTVCLQTKTSALPTFDTLREAASPIHHSIGVLDRGLTAKSLSERYAFMHAMPGNVVAIIPGTWEIKEPLIIPENVTLKLSPGVTLKNEPGVVIVVHGATDFQGTKDSPIIMQAANDNSKWNGIVVLQKPTDRSQWSHVAIRDTERSEYLGWATTGAVTFHRGSVRLQNVSIAHSLAEDALNIISAQIAIIQLAIDDARSDAFDCDFCQGTLNGLRVSNIGGDGFDVSGSKVTIENSRFRDVKDKAISVGEGSNISGKNMFFQDTGYAIVSKDGSSVQVDRIILKNIRDVGFMSYKKKSEYEGVENITARNVKFEGKFTLSKSSTGSIITINGKFTKNKEIDVENLYKSRLMQKN